jgi:phosphoglycolate phosphatase-like HAD superfamily hydrolase
VSGVDPGRAVMVGDTIWDVLAAERAGFGCIGLLCGGTAEAELLQAGAAKVYRDPAVLLGDIQASPIGRLGRG